MRSASASASRRSPTSPPDPGTVGTPASRIVFRAVALSPIARMWCAAGPMNVMCDLAQISANSAFSARKPYPGWMASAPVTSAAAMIRGMFRYDCEGGGGPMHTSSSEKRTWRDSRSASEYTATVETPSS